MYFKSLVAFTFMCFSFDLFAQLSLDEKTILIIDCTTRDNGNLWWGEEIPAKNLAFMKQCIAQGANPRVQNVDGISPIHYAAAAGDLEFIKHLVNAHGVNLNSPNKKGVTPLMVAAMFGKADAVELLSFLGANMEARDRKYRTALHWAATADAANSIATLCSSGANVHAFDSDGATPMNIASWMKNSRNEALYILMSYGAQLTRPVRWWAGWSQLLPITDTVQIMQNARTEMRSRTPDLFLPLRISSDIHNARRLLRRFLAYPAYRGRDINQFRNAFGNSLLFSAVYFRSIPCALVLLEHGANPLHTEYSGTSTSLVLANRILDFHHLNVLTGETYFQGMVRAAVWQVYLILAPLTRHGAPMFLAPDMLRCIAFLIVSLHIPEAERRL